MELQYIGAKEKEEVETLGSHTYIRPIQEAHGGEDAYALHTSHGNSFRYNHAVYVCTLAPVTTATITTAYFALSNP